jgi:pimeloyl-ACP methyl ester carboxylesterase
MNFVSRTDPAAVDELRRRIRVTRWPTGAAGADWAAGTDTAYLRELAAYWADAFDWEAKEVELNRLPRSFVEVGGQGIHVIHSVADRATPAPALLLAHGWPDSFWRYLKVLPLLAPEFDLVIPDMPGFGYSDAPVGASHDARAVARLWAELMTKLGYEKFFVAGGDIGSGVAQFLALDHPERVIAVHRMSAGLPVPGTDPATLTQSERDWLAQSFAWSGAEGAYNQLQRTKPDTAAFALTDSPVGLAAWIVEKLHSWSERGIDGYTMDEVLTNVSIYWFTGSIGPSMRMYRAMAQTPAEQLSRRVEVPSGFSIFPADINLPPREWAERTSNVVRFTHPEAGGHFAPFEVPELYAKELRDFFGMFR